MMEFFGEREDMLHRDESEGVGEVSPATLNLIDEHEKFRAKMAFWRKALSDAGSAELQNIFSEIVTFLDNDVEFHARIEDEAYFPALEPHHSTVLMYEAHDLIREEAAAFKMALERWRKGEAPFSKMQSALEQIFTLLNDHFSEEELVYFPIAEQKWSEKEKSGVWAKMKTLTP